MKLKDYVTPILAIVIVIAFLAYIAAITFIPHTADIGLVNIAVGWLGGTASSVASYYFGSSKSSQHKNEIISKMKSND